MKITIVSLLVGLEGTNAFIAPNLKRTLFNSRVNRGTVGIQNVPNVILSASKNRSGRMGFTRRKSPLKYLRILPKRTNRNKKKQRSFELQTAVTTLGKRLEDGTEVLIDLHAQVRQLLP